MSYGDVLEWDEGKYHLVFSLNFINYKIAEICSIVYSEKLE
jgi:hypothetical protein